MAGAEVTISGVLYDKHSRTVQNVVLIGEATITGLGVGGGPMPPGGGQPPWHGDPGYGKPTPPDATWGGRPGPGNGGSWVPAPPDPAPNPPGEGVKPPPPDGGWGYSPEYGWGYFPMGQSAGPKK